MGRGGEGKKIESWYRQHLRGNSCLWQRNQLWSQRVAWTRHRWRKISKRPRPVSPTEKRPRKNFPGITRGSGPRIEGERAWFHDVTSQNHEETVDVKDQTWRGQGDREAASEVAGCSGNTARRKSSCLSPPEWLKETTKKRQCSNYALSVILTHQGRSHQFLCRCKKKI